MVAPILTLSTDFGSGSSYVAQMKGVVLSASPQVQILDLSHDLPAHDIAQAELFLRRTPFTFPTGTTHVVVIDPGVGTARRPIAVHCNGQTFVGPDNGVLGAFAHSANARTVVLDRTHLFRHPVSSTFHGRDLFAPVGAELASGLLLEDVGSPIDDPLPSTLPVVSDEGDTIVGVVLGHDRFGNLLTNIPATAVETTEPVLLGEQAAQWVNTYGEGPPNQLLALMGSDGFLEFAMNTSSAAALQTSLNALSVFATRAK